VPIVMVSLSFGISMIWAMGEGRTLSPGPR
jgi:hypothetical protein